MNTKCIKCGRSLLIGHECQCLKRNLWKNAKTNKLEKEKDLKYKTH